MKNLLLITLLCSALQILGQQTYYTTGLGTGDYNDPASWTLTQGSTTPAGPPTAIDNLVINHYISHFSGKNYTHFGNVTIGTKGTYEALTGIVNSGPYIFAGDLFKVDGTLMTIDDFHHQPEGSDGSGVLIFSHTSLVYINGALVMNGGGQAIMDNVSCGAGQTITDLRFKGTDARVCGNGTFIVPAQIRAWDERGEELSGNAAKAHIAARICEGFTFYKNSDDCQNSTKLITGTGQFGLESDILSFGGKLENGKARFNWSVNRDHMNETFVIERSHDRYVFEVVSQMTSDKQTSPVVTYLAENDASVKGTVYFRLKKVSVTGKITYSNLIEITNITEGNSAFQISPNPSSGNMVQLRASGFDKSHFGILSIRTLLGQELHREAITIDSEGNLIQNVSHNLTRGTYLVVIMSSTHRVSQRLQIL